MTHLDPTGPDDGWDDPLADQLAADVRHAAHAAAESIRQLNHLTIGSPALPAPEVYLTLIDLERLGHGLAQGMRQLGVGLQRSLDKYDVSQDDASDPADAVDRCVYELLQAVADATDIGVRLGRARGAIARQGHHGRIPTITATDED